jgi:uncharacterized paraquat-inducible protein A
MPLTIGLLGAVSLLSNRHRGFSRNAMSFVILATSYKGLDDLIGYLGLSNLQIISYFFSIIALFSVAPLLYKYFQSLLQESYIFTFKDMKHFIVSFVLLGLTLLLALTVSKAELLHVLNNRFDEGRDFYGITALIFIYIIGYPLLIIQWILYFAFINKLIHNQKKRYGKFYGSYERRNEQLIRRVFFALTGVFIISFLMLFFQISQNLIIILSNIFVAILIGVAINAGHEQVDMKRYRMYKLNSHEEEIQQGELNQFSD